MPGWKAEERCETTSLSMYGTSLQKLRLTLSTEIFASVSKLLRLTKKANPLKPDPPVLAGIPTLYPNDYMHNLWAYK